jgi:hypothetical protein
MTHSGSTNVVWCSVQRPPALRLIEPTDLVRETGQKVVLDSVEMTCILAPDSEAPSEFLFHLPRQSAVCAAKDATHTMHNLYTLRGAKFRDGLKWSSTCRRRSTYSVMANQGMTPLDIGERIKLPESLDRVWPNRGYYGSLYHNARAQYGLYLCWFAGVPPNLHSLPPTETGKRYVESTPMKLCDTANGPTRSKPEDRRGRERRTGELSQRSNPDVRACYARKGQMRLETESSRETKSHALMAGYGLKSLPLISFYRCQNAS